MSSVSGDRKNNVCIWQCPACGNALEEFSAGYQCSDGHSYDRARQGYVNLMLANQKRSKDPGDGAEMVEARRNFLSAGHYTFLVDAIISCMQKNGFKPDDRLLDVGCGDGSYLHAIAQHFPEALFWGSDISKFAVRRAARYVAGAKFSVASNYHLPFQSGSIDSILSVFSPIELNEIKRVLQDKGIFIRVLPGEKHFWELKQALYKEPQVHEEPSELTGANLKERIHVRDTQRLDNHALKQLIGMTPLNWRGDSEAKTALFSLPSFEITFDFVIQVYTFEKTSGDVSDA